MTRAEMISRFRAENPEFSKRALPDTELHAWLKRANVEIAIQTGCIHESGTFNSIVGQETYDLVAELGSKFQAITETGGGVIYDNRRIKETSVAEMDDTHFNWRTSSNGVPRRYFRIGKVLHLYPKPDIVDKVIIVYFNALPDDFSDDNETPFNQLTFLEPYHYVFVLYLAWRARAAGEEPRGAKDAKALLDNFVQAMKEDIGGFKVGPIRLRPKKYYSSF